MKLDSHNINCLMKVKRIQQNLYIKMIFYTLNAVMDEEDFEKNFQKICIFLKMA